MDQPEIGAVGPPDCDRSSDREEADAITLADPVSYSQGHVAPGFLDLGGSPGSDHEDLAAVAPLSRRRAGRRRDDGDKAENHQDAPHAVPSRRRAARSWTSRTAKVNAAA